MFTLQASQLRAELLANEGNWERIVESLINAFGTCSAPIEHRGPVTFGGPNPPNSDPPTTIIDGSITQEYAINLLPGSVANWLGDSRYEGDIYNIDNTTNNYDVTEIYNGDSSVTYGGTTTITFGPNVNIVVEGEGNCVAVVTEVTPTETNDDFITAVTLQTTVVTAVTLQTTVVTDVDFDEETCELTVTTAAQSYTTGAQSYTSTNIDYISDVDVTTQEIGTFGECTP